MKALNKFATRKKKYSRGSNMPFMNNSLSRAHMKISRLRNCCLKKRSEQNILSYLKQRNYCVSFEGKDIVDKIQVWRTVKPLFSDKTKSNEKISLVEDETVTTQDEKNVQLFESFLFKCS